MKIAIINDTHFGARNDSSIFLNYFLEFFEEQFFPYCIENKIDQVMHLGDLMDRRKYVNFNTLHEVRKRFFEKFTEHEIHLHCIVGNHDTFYKNTNEINSLKELFTGKNDYFHLYEKPTPLEFGGLCVGLIPWMADENREECEEFLKTCACPFIAGHFELNGYEVFRGIDFKGGMEMTDELLKRFELVLSGHFHNKSIKNNVWYLGTQYQITFSDLNERKGFHVLDTETRELEFIENKRHKFYHLVYDDTEPEKLVNLNFKQYKDCYVKILVKNKTKRKLFDAFLDTLYKHKAIDITVVEDLSDFSIEETSIDMAKDTLTIINDEIDGDSEIKEKNEIKKIIRDLYMEGLSNWE
jgi:DNA repair exonuclease SbcCD nuclease subunit